MRPGDVTAGEAMRKPAGDLGCPADRVLALMRQLSKIPDEERRFSMSPAEAWQRHRISSALLDFMVAAGLPVHSAGGERLFDALDLTNVAFHLGTGPANRTSRRFWSAGLNREIGTGAVIYEIVYRPACPAPGHSRPCRYQLTRPGGRRVWVEAADTGRQELRVRVRLRTSWPILPPEVCEVIDTTKDLMLMWLPTTIATDFGFIRSTGLADCAGAAQLLVHESRLRGLEARTSWGLIVAPPFSTPHFWAEIKVGRTWVPIDPLLLKAMTSWGALERERWHPYQSAGAIFARVASRWVALAVHDGGQHAQVSLPTYPVAAQPPDASASLDPQGDTGEGNPRGR